MKPGLTDEDRKNAIAATTSDERTRFVAQLMSENRWVMAPWWQKDLAELWKCSPRTVRFYAATASKILRFDNREELHDQLVMSLFDLIGRAQKNVNQITGQTDIRAELEALKFAVEILGVKPAAPEATDSPRQINITLIKPPKPDEP